MFIYICFFSWNHSPRGTYGMFYTSHLSLVRDKRFKDWPNFVY